LAEAAFISKMVSGTVFFASYSYISIKDKPREYFGTPRPWLRGKQKGNFYDILKQ